MTAEDLVGRLLGTRYHLDALIGSGGMADVYRATDQMLQRDVAVKVLTDKSPAVQKRFIKEARSMASLNHPNIVGVYDAGETDGLSYIVMELVRGRTMRDIPAEELTFHKAVRYFIDLLEALDYAHSRSVIHRDIKPANVMVLETGQTKVMDFGLSRRADDVSDVTVAGEIVGTVAYLSPERFLGKKTDHRSDLYSVGIVMYELFTGTPPFRAENDDLVALIFAHVNEQPALPRTRNRAIPPQLEAIVMRLIEKDPDRRYQHACDVVDALKALLAPSGPGAAQQRPGARSIAPVTPTLGAMTVQAQSKVPSDVRTVLDKALGPTQQLNDAYANVLAAMLATRKGDYIEAGRAYGAALTTLKAVKNEAEYAKTALKYALMVAEKNSHGQRSDRRELDSALGALNEALPIIRGRRMHKELEEGERILYVLQRYEAN